MSTSVINAIQAVPKTVANLTLWLDAADTSTITLSGTSVTAVADKSSIKNNYVQTTAGNRPSYQVDPVYNKPGFLFTRGSGTNLTPSDNTLRSLNSSQWTIFFVCRFSDANEGSIQTIWRGQLIGYWTRFQIPGNASFYAPGSDVQFGRTFANASGVWCSVVSSSSQTIFLNGTQTGSGGRGNTSMSDYFTIGGHGAGEGLTGYIFEFLVYNTVALSSTDRQTIEGYLAWKWGLQASLPSNHPFARLNPGAPIYPIVYSLPRNTVNSKPLPYFDPRAISDCAMWLDAADTTTVTSSGGVVSQWIDKSTSALQFTQATVGARPTIVTNGPLGRSVYFTTAQSMSSVNSVSLSPTQSWFIVFQATSSANFFMIEQSPNTNSSNGSFLYGGNGDLHFIRRANGSNYIYDNVGFGVSPFSLNTSYVASLVNDNTSMGVVWKINGTARATTFRFPFTSLSGSVSTNMYINHRVPAQTYISEIIIFNSALTASQVQQLEGYLAWKWGLQANLPTTHPYKAGPPTPFPQLVLPRITRQAFRPIATRFIYTGAAQTYTVPSGVSTINIYLWGAGGGRSAVDGGAGAFVSGTLSVSPGATYSVVVGKSGNVGGNVRGTMAQGAGGLGAYTYMGGGGFSGIFSGGSLVLGSLVAIAGGGGTASFFGPRGGSGGVITGGSGTSPSGGYPGTGGTQTEGGTTLPGTFTATYGTQFFGGDFRLEGPGGGGGYWGGGGSDCRFLPGQLYAGSGGGSSYTGGFSSILATADGAVPNGSTTTLPGGTTNTYYVSPYGQALQHGYVVIVSFAP